METRLHRTLIVFPLGLLATSFIFDVAWLVTDHARLASVARWMIAAGVVGAVAAGVYCWIGWRAIPRGTRMRRVGAWHGLGNACVTLLFAASWMLREVPSIAAVVVSAVAVVVALVTAWVAGELVQAEGVGAANGRPTPT